MSQSSLFFRLLNSPIDSKGADLLQQIALQNQGEQAEITYRANPTGFSSIPGSPFAYWADEYIRTLFKKLQPFESEGREARIGLSTRSDIQFLRLFWEISERSFGEIWFSYAKGGPYSPYFHDLYLVVDWENDGERVKTFISQGTISSLESGDWSRWVRSRDKYFRPGLTWPRRTTSGISIRPFPSSCIFADKGAAAFVSDNNPKCLLALMALMNSQSFAKLVGLQLGAADAAARSYEVGLIQQTPVPILTSEVQEDLSNLALLSHNLARIPVTFNETTHVFRLPVLLSTSSSTLTGRVIQAAEQEAVRQAEMVVMQAQIDTRVAELYGLDNEKAGVPYGISSQDIHTGEESVTNVEENVEDEEDSTSSPVLHPLSLVSDLLLWCLGVAFGRWDARFALNLELLPALAGPFDPLPRCSPGMLLSPDGFPATQGNIVSENWLRARPDVLTLPKTVDGPETISDQEYPLPIAWDGILVDDPDHPRDLVTAVRRVLRLIWKEQADAIEQEACQILQVPDLRAYLCDPRLFFNFHVRRYSKSRRKAPIYWLLQSARRNYAVWLYYPRLNPDLLFRAGREYADAKINLETSRLKELQTNLSGLTGTNLKTRERQVARQVDLIEELKAFGKELDRVALLELKPDLNDGVLLNIAPLYHLVPWKEAEKAWKELVSGKYEWSRISQQLQQKGWVKK